MKKTLLGLLATVVLMGSAATMADAKTRVNFYFGTPYYDEQRGSDYFYYPGRGWYRDYDRRSYYSRPYQNRSYRRISCSRARSLVRNQGFRNVITRDCAGGTYTFSGRRNNQRVLLYVNARTGAVRRG